VNPLTSYIDYDKVVVTYFFDFVPIMFSFVYYLCFAVFNLVNFWYLIMFLFLCIV